MQERNTYNITIFSGADYRLDLTLTEDDGEIIDLTNLTLEAQLREYPEDNDYLTFTITEDNNVFSMTMPKVETEKISFTQGYYDIFITNTTTEIRSPLISGKANIISQVSRGETL